MTEQLSPAVERVARARMGRLVSKPLFGGQGPGMDLSGNGERGWSFGVNSFGEELSLSSYNITRRLPIKGNVCR